MALTDNQKRELADMAKNSTTSVKIRGNHALVGPQPVKYTSLSDIKKGGRLGS